MKNWELCPKCNGDKCECKICNGSGLISTFTGKPPEWSCHKTTTTGTDGNINITIKSTTT